MQPRFLRHGAMVQHQGEENKRHPVPALLPVERRTEPHQDNMYKYICLIVARAATSKTYHVSLLKLPTGTFAPGWKNSTGARYRHRAAKTQQQGDGNGAFHSFQPCNFGDEGANSKKKHSKVRASSRGRVSSQCQIGRNLIQEQY
jgi:hypothetical protein